MTTGEFSGFSTRVIENPLLRVEVLEDGPRVVRLSYRGGANLFGELPGGNETAYGTFQFLGGHRLWHSPEAMPRTYLPDLGEALVEDVPGGVRVSRPPEAVSGIVKQIEVRLDPQKALVTVRHELRNDGLWPVEFAPWALTVMRQGGKLILPQSVEETGLLPNRFLVIWPYTKINDPRLGLDDDFITLHATPSLPPIKLGYFNPHGWMAYWIDGVLFVKRYDAIAGANYPDGGCNTETYCNDAFIEMETLGALVKLQPGESAVHTETWECFDSLDQPFLPKALKAKLR
jgi:hypothetical protein